MSDDEPQFQLPQSDMRRYWRMVTWAGLLGTTYYILCVTGAPRIKFLRELNATAFDFGLIAGIRSFALVFQLVGSLIANRLRHRKYLWMCIAITHRLIFIAVLLAPVLFIDDRTRLWWIILVLFFHDSLAQVGVPMWMSWMADFVPKNTMTRYWATRQRLITGASVLVMIAVALSFHYFENTGRIILGFSILAGIGIIVGIIDILLFIRVPEPPYERPPKARVLEVISQPLKDKQFRTFLTYSTGYYFAVFVAAPFLSLYLMEDLGMSVMTVQLLWACSSLGIVLASRTWGLLCDTYGYRPVVRMLTVVKSATPLFFLFAPKMLAISIPMMAVLMMVDGLMNAGMVLSFQGILLKSTPKQNKAMYIAAANFMAMGVAASIAPVGAGKLIDYLNTFPSLDMGIYHFNGYHAAFALSAVLRFMTVPLANRIHQAQDVPVMTVIKQINFTTVFKISRLIYRLHGSEKDAVRLDAARQLALLKNPIAITDLINALEDSSQEVREAAAEALGDIGSSDACEPLARALFNPNSGIQLRAAKALGRIGGVHSLRALSKNLKNHDSSALHETVDSLVKIGHDAAILPLLCLFHELENTEIREHIVQALVKLGQTESPQEIMNLLQGRRPAISAAGK